MSEHVTFLRTLADDAMGLEPGDRQLASESADLIESQRAALSQIALGCGDDDETGALHYNQIGRIAQKALSTKDTAQSEGKPAIYRCGLCNALYYDEPHKCGTEKHSG